MAAPADIPYDIVNVAANVKIDQTKGSFDLTDRSA